MVHWYVRTSRIAQIPGSFAICRVPTFHHDGSSARQLAASGCVWLTGGNADWFIAESRVQRWTGLRDRSPKAGMAEKVAAVACKAAQ